MSDAPDFDSLGWNFTKHALDGRPEPMNRLGHAPTVACVLLAGHVRTHKPEMLAAARLNVLAGPDELRIDLDAVLRAWLGDGAVSRHPWWVTAGMRLSGLTRDGLDAAHEGDGFYAFTMASLQNPAWNCVATDWFHPPAFPTTLLWNPYPEGRDIRLPQAGATAPGPFHIYDLVPRRFLARDRQDPGQIHLLAETAVVAVMIPATARLSNRAGRFMADGIVVDWTGPGPE